MKRVITKQRLRDHLLRQVSALLPPPSSTYTLR
jgi:hypothetical protein